MEMQKKWEDYQEKTSQVKIRFANQNDIPVLAEIEKTCFPAAEAASFQEIKVRFEAFGESFLVAVIDNQVVGFINGCVTQETILYDEVYHDVSLHQPNGAYQTVFGLDVLPAYRHQGISDSQHGGAVWNDMLLLFENTSPF